MPTVGQAKAGRAAALEGGDIPAQPPSSEADSISSQQTGQAGQDRGPRPDGQSPETDRGSRPVHRPAVRGLAEEISSLEMMSRSRRAQVFNRSLSTAKTSESWRPEGCVQR